MQSYYVQLFFTVLLVLLISSVQSQDDRLMGWNKANGLWGKRSTGMDVFEAEQKRPEQNWAKLNTLWGKRSAAGAPGDLSAFLETKRAQWQMANGLWGR